MNRLSRRRQLPFSLGCIFVLLILATMLTAKLRAPFYPSSYRDAIAKIGEEQLQREVDQLIDQRRDRPGRNGNYQWQDISSAPPAIRRLPYVQRFSAQEDSVQFVLPDLHFSVLLVYHSDQTSLPAERVTSYDRFRRVCERVYMYEEWYLWPQG